MTTTTETVERKGRGTTEQIYMFRTNSRLRIDFISIIFVDYEEVFDSTSVHCET